MISFDPRNIGKWREEFDCNPAIQHSLVTRI